MTKRLRELVWSPEDDGLDELMKSIYTTFPAEREKDSRVYATGLPLLATIWCVFRVAVACAVAWWRCVRSFVCVRVCVRSFVCVCVCVRVCARVRSQMRARWARRGFGRGQTPDGAQRVRQDTNAMSMMQCWVRWRVIASAYTVQYGEMKPMRASMKCYAAVVHPWTSRT